MNQVSIRTEHQINGRYVSHTDATVTIDEAATIIGAAAKRYGRPKVNDGVKVDERDNETRWTVAYYPAWKEEPDGYGRTYRSTVNIVVIGASARQLRDQYKIGR